MRHQDNFTIMLPCFYYPALSDSLENKNAIRRKCLVSVSSLPLKQQSEDNLEKLQGLDWNQRITK